MPLFLSYASNVLAVHSAPASQSLGHEVTRWAEIQTSIALRLESLFLHEIHIMIILCNEKTVIVIITLLLLFSSGGRLREMSIMNIQGNGPA